MMQARMYVELRMDIHLFIGMCSVGAIDNMFWNILCVIEGRDMDLKRSNPVSIDAADRASSPPGSIV